MFVTAEQNVNKDSFATDGLSEELLCYTKRRTKSVSLNGLLLIMLFLMMNLKSICLVQYFRTFGNQCTQKLHVSSYTCGVNMKLKNLILKNCGNFRNFQRFGKQEIFGSVAIERQSS